MKILLTAPNYTMGESQPDQMQLDPMIPYY